MLLILSILSFTAILFVVLDIVKFINSQENRKKSTDSSTNYLRDPSVIKVLKSYNWMYKEISDNIYSDYDDIINEINNLFISGHITMVHLNYLKERPKKVFFANFREVFYTNYVFQAYARNPESYNMESYNMESYSNTRYYPTIDNTDDFNDVDDVEKRDLLNSITESTRKLLMREIGYVYNWREIENKFEYPESPSVKKFKSIVLDILLILKQWKFADLKLTHKILSEIDSILNPLRERGDIEDLTPKDQGEYYIWMYMFVSQVDIVLRTLRRWKFLKLMSMREFSLQIRDTNRFIEAEEQLSIERQSLREAQYHPYGCDK